MAQNVRYRSRVYNPGSHHLLLGTSAGVSIAHAALRRLRHAYNGRTRGGAVCGCGRACMQGQKAVTRYACNIRDASDLATAPWPCLATSAALSTQRHTKPRTSRNQRGRGLPQAWKPHFSIAAVQPRCGAQSVLIFAAKAKPSPPPSAQLRRHGIHKDHAAAPSGHS